MKKISSYILLASILIGILGTYLKTNVMSNEYERWELSTQNKKNYNDIKILIDITEKTLYVISDGEIIKKYPIASGKPDTPSPIGDFTIVQKAKWGEGFGSSWLGLNVPWGKYGIHGTTKPESIGHSASHGCIRMRNKDVDELYKIVKLGTPVKITGGSYGMIGNGFRKILPGDRGSDVFLVQKRLKELGFYDGNVDGIYGKDTERALNKFQKFKGLPITNIIDSSLYKAMGIILFE